MTDNRLPDYLEHMRQAATKIINAHPAFVAVLRWGHYTISTDSLPKQV